MTSRTWSPLLVLVLVALTGVGSSLLTARVVAAPPGAPLTTAVPFQGVLQENGVPVNEPRNFGFTLFDAASGGAPVSSTVNRVGLPVTDGLYATTLDFGIGPWNTGEARWIEVTVNGQPLAPRTPLLAAPQALYAVQAGTAASATSATTATNATTANNALALSGLPAAQFGRLYGDGSAGALVAPAGASVLAGLVADGNYSFTDVTIPAGATLLVPAGATIRCTGSFTVEAGGSLDVSRVLPAYPEDADATWSDGLLELPAAQGVSTPGGPGQPGLPGDSRTGGIGGGNLLHPQGILDSSSGGSGSATVAAAPNGFPQVTGGGGAILIRCAGPVVNQGLITARGGDGGEGGTASPGGGGGVVLIGSGTSITSTAGTINARGGNASNATAQFGRGGGGGGGLVRLVAPAVNAPDGQINVSGGTIGTGTTVNNGTGTRGGGGGGGSCGAGGRGDSLSAANTTGTVAAQPGTVGCIIRTIASPQAVWD